jgi:hypothetical protein
MRVALDTPDGQVVLDDEVLAPHRDALADGPDPAPARLAYAAAHVCYLDSYAQLGHSLEATGDPAAIAAHVDWPATADVRRHLDANGFGVAEAMDTAQRFEVGWEVAEQLIRATAELELEHGFVAGAGYDQVKVVPDSDALVEAVVSQARTIQRAGGDVVLLPMAWLTERGASEDAYVSVYVAIADALDGPLWVHWLGEAFSPALRGYFPGDSFARVMAHDPEKIRGAKLSLLDADVEVRIRRELLARGQLVLTGDDFHFEGLIRGASPWAAGGAITAPVGTARVGLREVPVGDFSHALLGILDAVAEPAGLALRALGRDDAARYHALMAPCEKLSRWVFRHPTRHYKAGLAFLSYLAGRQPNALLANREDLAHDRRYFLRCARLASEAGCVPDAEEAARRLEAWVSSRE